MRTKELDFVASLAGRQRELAVALLAGTDPQEIMANFYGPTQIQEMALRIRREVYDRENYILVFDAIVDGKKKASPTNQTVPAVAMDRESLPPFTSPVTPEKPLETRTSLKVKNKK